MGEPPHPPTVFYVTQRWDSNDNKETFEVFVLSICSMVPGALRDLITSLVDALPRYARYEGRDSELRSKLGPAFLVFLLDFALLKHKSNLQLEHPFF